MKPITLGGTFFAPLLFASILFATLFSFASAASVSVIAGGNGSWSSPVPYSFYSYTSPVHVTGSYTLPPDWVGTIYIWQDGVQLPQTLTISNLGGPTPKPGVFDIDLGIQPATPSPHIIFIEFFGGSSCFIMGTCPGTASNWTDESVSSRSYTASNTPDPVLSISYDANGTIPLNSPAFNFSNVPVNTTDTRTLYVRNVGGGTAVGAASIAGGPNPFYCVGTCTYSIPAGAPAVPIQVQYAPTSIGMNSSAILNFGCTTPLCSQVNADLTGDSVAAATPPLVTLSASSLNFGTVNVGSFADIPLTISNTGGGVLTGTITFGNGAYSCIPNCNYTIPSGSSYTPTIRFTPTAQGTQNTTANFSGGSAAKSISVSGSGNTKTLINVNVVGSWNPLIWQIDDPVAVGQTLYQDVEIRNVGVGVMSGRLSPSPGDWQTAGWHCTGVTQNGVTVSFDDATPCTFANLVNGGPPAIVHLSFVGSLANIGTHGESLVYQNTTDPYNVWGWVSAEVTLDAMLQLSHQDIWFQDSLLNVPLTYTVNYQNLGTTPINNFVINLPVGAGVFTCQNPLQCNTPLVIPAGGDIDVTYVFTPTSPMEYWQSYEVCLGATCGSYIMNGQGNNPHLAVVSAIPGGENMDTKNICAIEGGTCAFSGTKTVYYGVGTQNTSKSLTDGALCSNAVFGDPAAGKKKFCWMTNENGGTWINKPWTTRNKFTMTNDGMGGDAEWRIVNTGNFICDASKSGPCTENIHNHDNTTGTRGNAANVYFNPSAAGSVTENLTIEYHYRADINAGTPTDCPGGMAKWCHSMTIPLSGTGISGAHLTYSLIAFPTTNVGATSTANLTVINDGTITDLGVEVVYVDGEFSCTANCGPYDIPAGSSQVATLSFTPTSAGTKTGHFNLTSTNAPTASVTVTGRGNSVPIISILNPTGGMLDYGVVNQGSQLISGDGILAPIIVTNIGAGLLTGDAILTDGTHYKCLSCHYEALAPGATQEIKVAFIPKNIGTLNDILTLSGGGSVTFNLFGIGALGASNISSPDTNFGKVVVRAGNFKEQVVTVYNQGTVDVPNGEITLSGPFSCTHPPTPFNAVTGKCTYPVIPAGGSVQFTIRFTPTAGGPASGVMALSGTSNARVRLSGTGVIPSVKFKEQ